MLPKVFITTQIYKSGKILILRQDLVTGNGSGCTYPADVNDLIGAEVAVDMGRYFSRQVGTWVNRFGAKACAF